MQLQNTLFNRLRPVLLPAKGKKGMRDARLPLTRIAAAIYCERPGQKAILIGRGGEMLKRIGTAARKEIEALSPERAPHS